MAFDVEGALKAGYSEQEVANFLGQQRKFDTQAALASGYTPRDIISHLSAAAPPTTAFGQAKEFFKGIPAGAVGLLESAATGASALLPEDMEKSAREKIKSVATAAKAPFTAAPGYEEAGGRKFGEAVGSTVPFFAAGPLGMAGRVGATALGVGAGAGEARVRAEEGKAEAGDRGTATALGSVVGATEMLPVFSFIKNLGKPLADGISSQIRRAFATGGAEAAQEAAAQAAQNLIAKGLYKPEQAIIEGTGEAAAYGGATGALIQGLTDMALGRRAKGAAPAAQPPVQEPPAQEPIPAAPVALTERPYPELAKEVARISKLADTREATPEEMVQLKAIRAELQKRGVAEVEGQRAAATADKEGPAKFPALAAKEPEQMEMREALPEGPLPPETDLFGAPLLPKAAQPEGLADVIGAELPATSEVMRDAGLAPTTQELETAGQMRLVPPGAITATDITQFGVMSKANRQWLTDNVLGKTPDEVRDMVETDPASLPRVPVVRKAVDQIVQAATPKEAPSVQAPAEVPAVPPVQPRLQPRGSKPSVGVPVQPAGADTVAPRATGAPTGVAPPVSSGLVPPKQPAAPGVAPTGQPAPALTTETAAPALQTLIDTAGTALAKKRAATTALAALQDPKLNETAEDKAGNLRLAASILGRTVAPAAPVAAKPAKTAPPTPAPAGGMFGQLVKSGAPDIVADEAPPPAAPVKPASPFDVSGPSTLGAQLAPTAEESKAAAAARKKRSVAEPYQPKQTLEQLTAEVRGIPGLAGMAIRRMLQTGKLVLKEASPDGADIGGEFDGRVATLFASGTRPGAAISVVLHEVGAHLGLKKMVGANNYDAVIAQIKQWATGPKSPERALAQRALSRIPNEDIEQGAEHYNDEVVAYFVEEAAKADAANELPKVGPLRALWNQIKTHILSELNRALGTNFGLNDLTPRRILELAQAATTRAAITAPTAPSDTGTIKKQLSVAVPTGTRTPNQTLMAQAQPLVPKSAGAIQQMQNAVATLAGKNSTVPLATRIRTALVDPLASVEQKISNDYDRGITDALGNTTATIVARQAQDVTKLMQAFYEDGSLVVNPKTRMLEVRKGKHAPDDLFPIIRKMAEDLGVGFEEGFAYTSTVLEGMKLNELVKANASGATDVLIHWRTPTNAIDYAKIKAAVNEYNSDPRYKQLSDIMDAPRIGLINELEKSGRLTPETAKEWRDVAHYVPYDRMEDFAKSFNTAKQTSSKGLARLGRLPKLVGSNWRPVGNVFENYFKTTGWMASQLAKQNANSYMMDAMVSAGFASRIPDPKLSKTGFVIPGYERGEERYYEVASKWDQMAFMDNNGPMPKWVKFFAEVGGVLRTAVTANPIFAASQVAQDVQGALLFSGVKNPVAFVSAAIGNFGRLSWHETVNAYKAARGEITATHKIEQDMRRLGLSGEVDYTATNPAVEELFRQGVRKRTKLGSTTLGAIIHGLEQITHSSDLAVRKALYDDEMRNSNDVLQASTKAREMINFRRRGSSQWVQHWVSMVPFFNAALQSTDIVYRAVTSKADASGLARQAARAQFKRNIAMYGGAALAYALMSSGDDDYEKMDRRTRDNNWVFPGNVRIPIRGDMGVVKVAIENGVDYMRRHGTPEELDAIEAIKTALWFAYEQYGGRNVRAPTAIQPLLENFANFSFMTGRSQIGTYQQTKPKHLQETSGTTETAKAIASFVEQQLTLRISPVHIDNVLRGYLGTTAASITMLTDAAMYPDRPDRPLHKMVALGAFAWDETQLTNPKNEFYALQEKVLPVLRAFNDMQTSDPERAEQYAAEHETELMLASTITQTLADLSKIRQYAKYLRGPVSAKESSSEERAAELLQLQKYDNELVAYVREVRHELKF